MTLRKDSIAVITGAGSGIGRALALRLARESIAGLAIADVNAESLTETERLIGRGVKVTTHRVDVSNADAVAAFADEVISLHGRVTHLINNAGVALGGRFNEISLDEIGWLMGVNFWGVVHGTKFFMPHLEKESSAHIVNISSLYGMIAPAGETAYCASKFAVRGFTESLRHELEGTNISVSVVHPGGIKTNIVNSARIGAGVKRSESEIQRFKDKMNRNLSRTSPEDAADVIVRGIRTRQPRILIGTDARIISILARILPRRYFAAINLISGNKLKDA